MKKIILIALISAFSISVFAQSKTAKFREGVTVGATTDANLANITKIVRDANSLYYLYEGAKLLKPYIGPLTDIDTTITKSNTAKELTALGGRNYLTEPVGEGTYGGGTAMVSGTIYFTALKPVKDTLTFSTVDMWMNTAGSYTANNTNGIALYKVSGVNVVKVAETPNTGTVWATNTSSTLTLNFSTPYQALPGEFLYSAILYSSSAQTTAPTPTDAYSTGAAYSNFAIDATGARKMAMTITGQTGFGSSYALSGLGRTTPMRGTKIR